MQIKLPYFDVILSRLECGDQDFEEMFGRHIHFGVWEDPCRACDDPADGMAALDRLCQRLIQLADVRDGQDVLDVGCGLGGTLATLDEQFSRVNLTGLNIDARQIEVARRRVTSRPGNRLDFVLGDACAMAFADASFDRVMAIECIFHFPSRKAFFEHVRRVLRPGGNLTMTDFLQPEGAPASYFDNTGEWLWGPHSAINLQDYRDLGAQVGLVLTHHQDITAFVRPTFQLFGALLGRHYPAAELITNGGMFVADAGGLSYSTLRFDLAEAITR